MPPTPPPLFSIHHCFLPREQSPVSQMRTEKPIAWGFSYSKRPHGGITSPPTVSCPLKELGSHRLSVVKRNRRGHTQLFSLCTSNTHTPTPGLKEDRISLWTGACVAHSSEMRRWWRSLAGGGFPVGLLGLSPSRVSMGVQRWSKYPNVYSSTICNS